MFKVFLISALVFLFQSDVTEHTVSTRTIVISAICIFIVASVIIYLLKKSDQKNRSNFDK